MTLYYALSEPSKLNYVHFIFHYNRKYRNRAFIGTASGYVYVYTRPKGEI